MYGHSPLMFSRLIFLLSLLNALSAPTNNGHTLFSSWKLFFTECIAASMPDSRLAYVNIIPAAQVVSSFNNLVIVLLMFWRRNSPAPTGLMTLSFFFSGTSLHVRRVDM